MPDSVPPGAGLSAGDRYVAMGSSFAAGPGISPRSPGSPRRAGRSARNYAHLVAEGLGLALHDVTYSGATAAQMLAGRPGIPAQVDAVTTDTRLVTVTCGGNDVGYLPRLTLASLPRPLPAIPAVRGRISEFGDQSDNRFATLADTLDRLLDAIRRRAPRATVLLVDYLTILPADGSRPVGPLPPEIAAWGRRTAEQLAACTHAAATRGGAVWIGASAASRDHHAWAKEPWTKQFHLSLRGGAPYHPNAEGMHAVAGLIREALA